MEEYVFICIELSLGVISIISVVVFFHLLYLLGSKEEEWTARTAARTPSAIYVEELAFDSASSPKRRRGGEWENPKRANRKTWFE